VQNYEIKEVSGNGTTYTKQLYKGAGSPFFGHAQATPRGISLRYSSKRLYAIPAEAEDCE